MLTSVKKNSRKIKVIIVEDQKIFRQALRTCLEAEGIEVIAEAENGKILLQFLLETKLKPDVILLDLEMPVMDGGKALIEIRKFDKEQKIIMLTYLNNEDLIIEMKRNGVNVFLDKNTELDTVVEEIKKLYSEINHTNLSKKIMPKFTKLEHEIMNLIMQSKTTFEIAEIRNRTVKSIEAKRKNIYLKVGCTNLADFILFCKSEGVMYMGRTDSKN